MNILQKIAVLPTSLRRRFSRARRLRRVMSVFDALQVVCRTTRNRSVLYLTITPIGRRVTIRANTSDVKCIEKVFVEKEYRLPADINPEFATNPKFIVDAGANIGMATLYFSHTFPDAKIVAIEPEASNFELLRSNCENIKNIKLENAALWSSKANLELTDPTVENWSFSVQPVAQGLPSVKSITLPEVLTESGMDRIDILKLDIEGAERELFSESCEEWLPKVGMIVIELHDRYNQGCCQQFYSHMVRRRFVQEICGENVFLVLESST